MSSPLLSLREGRGAGPRPAGKAGAGPQPLVAGDPPPAAGAWKREMERAQLDSWFKPGQTAPGDTGRPTGEAGQAALNAGGPQLASPKNAATAGVRTRSLALTSGPAANRAPVLQGLTPAATSTPKFETGRMVAADVRLGGLALALAGISRLKMAASRPGSADSPALAEVPEAPEAADALTAGIEKPGADERAIRLHAEWQGQDVSVWLGIDVWNKAGTEEEQLAQLLRHISACLHEQRSRLVKLVCNGKIVFEVSPAFLSAFPYSTQPKESP